MTRTARVWFGAGPLSVSGLVLCGALAWADTPAASVSLPQQLLNLASQAQEQGRPDEAKAFAQKALDLEPGNAEAKRRLRDLSVVRLARQVPAAPAPAEPTQTTPGPVNPGEATAPLAPNVDPTNTAPGTPAPPEAPGPTGVNATPGVLPTQPGATILPPPPAPAFGPSGVGAGIAREEQLRNVQAEQLTAATRERIEQSRALLRGANPQGALDTLRLGISNLDAAAGVSDALVRNLRRELEVEYRTTLRRQEEIELGRAENLRRAATAEQQLRALDNLQTRQQTVSALMTQFDSLIDEGIFNVLDRRGTGDIISNSKPFFDARLLAQQASALEPRALAPRLGYSFSPMLGFLYQTRAYEELKEYRYMQTMLDVDRASVPFPDTITIEYPDADFFRAISEKRIARYESVDLVDRSEQTLAILRKLDQPITMPFPNDTPLEEVLNHIKQATADANLPNGIPIYVDPIGLQEADRTEQSPVKIDLEGVPLKTTLRLLLNQLDLTSTVKDGMLTITSKDAGDTPTEIRVYPVADLAMIPMNLMGGGGGMGGGMGGMGGMGMGGGMGGGGMGGMGGGMGGGFRSVPIAPVQDQPKPDAFGQKKRN